MNNNIKLPTSGSTNWGAGLNSYLQNLSYRVDNLEKKYNDDTNLSKAESVGYAGSGVVGEFSATLASGNISVSGNLYLSGPEPLFFNNFSETYSLENVLSQPDVDATKPLFMFLFYDSVTKEWTLQASKEFNINYKYILIGLYYNDTFVKYYFSSGKTLMQHSYELEHVWADLDTGDTVLTINIGSNGMPTILNGDNGIEWDGQIILNCGGLQTDNMRIGDTVIEGKENIGKNPKKIVTIVDANFGTITPTLSSLTDTDGGKYFRILVDVFGTLIVQQSIDSYQFGNNNTANIQALYNAKFGNISSIWYAGLPVEIARFGYNKGDVVNFQYVQNSLNNSQMNFYFAKAIEGSFLTQQRKNIWLTDDSQIYVDKILFRKNYNDVNHFKLNYVPTTTKLIRESGSYQVTSEGECIITDFSNVADDIITTQFLNIPYSWKIVLDNNELFSTQFFWGDEGASWTYSGSGDSSYIMQLNPNQGVKVVVQKSAENIYLTTLIPLYRENFSDDWIEVVPSARDGYLDEVIVYLLLRVVVNRSKTTENIVNFDFTTLVNSENVMWEQTKSERSLILNSPLVSLQTTGATLLLNDGKITLNGPITVNGEMSVKNNLLLLVNNDLNLNSKTMNVKNGVLNLNDSKIKFTGSSVIDSGLHINGDVVLNYGTVKVLSDSRFKENIRNNESDFLSVVVNTPIVNYNYKNSDIKYIGLLAQDLSSNLEDDALFFVDKQPTEDCPNKLVIKETKLIYILWKALQKEVEERKKLEALIKEGMYYGSTIK